MSIATVGQASALAAPLVRYVYFVEFQFSEGTVYLSTLNQPITWGGNTWTGLGTIGGISQVTESDSMTTAPLSFTINAAQPEWLALAVGAVESYRGLPAFMYFCPLDASYQLVDTPMRCWAGLMDTVTIDIGDVQGSITLKCETTAYGLKRAASFRMNAAQQRSVYPTDGGFDYVNDLINNPAVWLSKLFPIRMKITLPQYITERLGKPFVWGEHDCVLFAIGWVEIATGIDYLSAHKPWTTALEATRKVDQLGGMEALLDANFTRINPHLALDGDIAQIGQTTFLFTGPHVVSVGESRLVFLSRMDAKMAWRTPR